MSKELLEQWPDFIREVSISSTLDGSKQAAMYYQPDRDEATPLLVGLHTWSCDYSNPSGIPLANWCYQRNWTFIHPNFRGPNKTPQAMGSELVIQDIIDAVDYAKSESNIDTNRIYLLGGSGGGYATLLMAGKHPDIWTAASSWCPILDLNKWHKESKERNSNYAEHIEAASGGIPSEDTQANQECQKRSAITYLHSSKHLPLDIATGIHDGHTGSVPISHAFEAFNCLAKPEDQISKEDIDYMVKREEVPQHLKSNYTDSLYEEHQIHFRRVSNNVRITIFEGGHDILNLPALYWLEKQTKGNDIQWKIETHNKLINLDLNKKLSS